MEACVCIWHALNTCTYTHTYTWASTHTFAPTHGLMITLIDAGVHVWLPQTR